MTHKTFEDLEKALPENRVDQIKKSNRNLPVLIIGGSRELVNGIVSYFYFTHPVINLKGDNNSPEYISSLFEATLKGYTGRIRFQEVDYTGRPEGYIHEDIESKLEHYFNGGMLFLRGIEDKFGGVFKFLASKACNRKKMRGVLTINTNGTNNLPQDLKDRFEVIDLEPEKQSKPVSTPQDTASTPQKQGKTKDVIHFPTHSGTQWHEVKISFIDNENVKISVRDKTETKHFSGMGFRKGNTCKPVESWRILFALSEKNVLKYSQSSKSKTEKGIQDLRKRLKTYFGIQDDPIVLEHGYKPVFTVCGSENKSRSVYAFSNSDTFDDEK